jgi:prepilin-type processing-associated H-X9-DG protein
MANAGRAETAPEFNRPQYGVFLDQMPLEEGAPTPSTTEAFISDQGDGMGKTLMLAENIQLLFEEKSLAPGQTGTRWDVPSPRNEDWSLGNKTSNVVVWHCIANPDTGMKVGGVPGQRFLNPGTAHPASNHPGGANVAFCDTRVTVIRNDIDYRVYIRLMAPHDLGATRLDSRCADVLGPLQPMSSSDYE